MITCAASTTRRLAPAREDGKRTFGDEGSSKVRERRAGARVKPSLGFS